MGETASRFRCDEIMPKVTCYEDPDWRQPYYVESIDASTNNYKSTWEKPKSVEECSKCKLPKHVFQVTKTEEYRWKCSGCSEENSLDATSTGKNGGMFCSKCKRMLHGTEDLIVQI